MRKSRQQLCAILIQVTLILPIVTACSHLQPVSPSPVPVTAASTQSQPTPISDALAVKVNGEGITIEEYSIELQQIQNALQAMQTGLPEGQQCQTALDALIDERLLAQAADKNGFEVDEAELRSRLDRIAPLIGDHLTPEALSASIRRWSAAAWQRDRILAQVSLRADQVHARQILLSRLEEANQALDQLRQGQAVFEDLAAQISPDSGGDLGWFPQGALTQPAIEEAAFALQPGELSPVIHTPLGYHLVQVTAVQGDRPLTPAAYRTGQRKALAAWLRERRAQSQVKALVSCAGGEQSSPETNGLPEYVAQPGDSFTLVAREFKVPVSELIEANPDANPDMLSEGQHLSIPGREGMAGELTVEKMPAGETAEGLARRVGIPWEDWIRLNRVVNPEELYAGSLLALPVGKVIRPAAHMPSLQAGQAVMEFAAIYHQNPWVVAWANLIPLPVLILPSELLMTPPGQEDSAPPPPEPRIVQVTVDPQSIEQGNTAVIHVETSGPVALSGRLDGRELRFFEAGNNHYAAIQGIHAMAEPGLTDLSVTATMEGRQTSVYEQAMWLERRSFIQDPPLQVDPATIDPANTKPEEDQIAALTTAANPGKLWGGLFIRPVDPSCRPSGYGNRRSYNGSAYTYFHGGLDYGLCDSKAIYAPAAGEVVFTGSLTVRGNATIIDHGWGIYSGFWHQSAIDVRVGDTVAAGQVIGQIGATGRVTGDHLHWEIWANGVQVDPVVWLVQAFP